MAGKKLDLAIPLTAAGAIFGALVGTTLLDVSNRARPMQIADYATRALWIPVFLLFALLAAWPDSRPLRLSAWIVAGIVALVTAGVIFFTSFGFTRDTDNVDLRVDPTTRSALNKLCGPLPRPLAGVIRTESLSTNFVILDLDLHKYPKTRCRTVDIPRSAVLAIQEHPKQQY
jgi:hypothetical protein